MNNQTIATTSKRFNLKLNDWTRGLLIAAISPVIAAIADSINQGTVTLNWRLITMAAIGGGLAYITKNFLSPAKIVVTGATPEVMKAVKEGDIDVKIGRDVAKVTEVPEPEKVDISKFPPTSNIPKNDKSL